MRPRPIALARDRLLVAGAWEPDDGVDGRVSSVYVCPFHNRSVPSATEYQPAGVSLFALPEAVDSVIGPTPLSVKATCQHTTSVLRVKSAT